MKDITVLILTRTIGRSSHALFWVNANTLFLKNPWTNYSVERRLWRDNESLQWFYWQRTFHFVSSTVGLFWNCFDYQGLYFTKLKNSSQKHNFSLLQKPPGKIFQFSGDMFQTNFRNYYLTRFDCREQVMALQQHIHTLHKHSEIF